MMRKPKTSHAAVGPEGQARPLLIAVVGCDGSGKTTVTEALRSWLSDYGRPRLCHLGKQSGTIGRQLVQLPFVGKRVNKTLKARSGMTRAPGGPDTVSTFVIWLFVLRRVLRFKRMLRLRRAGFWIIADRFPQIAKPGAIDGPRLMGVTQAPGLIGWMARSEQRHFETMVSHVPDLVLRLNVSAEVAIARKPDHRPAALTRKVVDVSQLTFQGAPIVEVNTDLPLEEVLSQARKAIAERFLPALALPSDSSPPQALPPAATAGGLAE
ncbi:nucleoside triphosphate hydrolase [Novosphingobium sp. 1949]|uniref:Nucleoside triphosphate hydrolase n=1 Tax=Novosphingobium organovorum TaxID=2930092 RepID=A0ABT0BCE6_9SPHN|nr:nucleoside triphosphate hydrolase [Novosphingobium organovorum]MCJ2182663.1 nucleoside triphosphate hydrolase [Novosphingobium organovorum]